MAQLTNLNVSPYYDDFDKDDNFNRVLFRPGFAVQARELTTLQSILQDQIESQGSHIFKEGTVVIPGQISYSDNYTTVQLASTFGGEDIVPSQFFNATSGVTITGSTSGVKAKVIGYQAATSTTQPILFIQYISVGTDNATNKFSDAENITADTTITHTSSYSSGVAAATTYATAASQTGSAVKIEAGIYYIRGSFIRCVEETLLLSVNSITESARVGFTITETLITPEADTTLTDNATGSANYAAKGAHRLKISLSLSKLALTSTADASFVELMRVSNGVMVSEARSTEYSVLGDTLARRTYDESGDYTVRPFQYEMKESVTNDYQGITNSGVYTSGSTTDDNNTASESLLSLAIQPGKAYVKGYEIEKIATTFKDINKARDFNTVNAGVVTFELGNFVNITNAYQIPDIGSVTGETTPYKTIGLFDGTTTTRGTASGTQIGVARARSIEHSSGTQGDTTAILKLYLFDVRPFTFLTISGTPAPALTASPFTNGGVQIIGATSGATGFVHASLTSGTQIVLTTVIGNFVTGEKLIASNSALTGKLIEIAGGDGATDITIGTASGSIISKRFSDVRSFFMDDADGGEDFTADAVLESSGQTGRIGFERTDASGANIGGNLLLVDDPTNKVALEDFVVARLKQPEKNVALFKLPKNTIKTLLTTTNAGASDTQYTVRRNFVGVTNASGVVTFSAGTNETFVGFSTTDYQMSVLTAGDGGSATQGDIILLTDDKLAGEGSTSLTITDNTLLGDGAKVKLYATLLKTSVSSKAKTTKLSKELIVLEGDAGTQAGAYGTRAIDRDISFGRSDVYKVQAVFDSEDATANAAAPQFTISNLVGTFLRGEKITGGSSNAVARVISTVSPIRYVLTAGFGATDFTVSETITGAFSGATATVGTLTAGSKVVTNSFTLDNGQRDNFYDIARLVRKPAASAPLGRLLVIYDYFSHGTGDVFTIDSYSNVAGQMSYDDIPIYTATRVDPDAPEPTGEFDLRDCFDFRPAVEDIAGTSATLSTEDTVTGNSFDFFSRQYDGVGSSPVDTPKPASSVQADFEYYLPKYVSLFLTTDGNFEIIEGISAEEPSPPKDLDNALKLSTILLPAYTFAPRETIIQRFKTQRFTMRDIGRLKARLEAVEYYTSLSLLERTAESFEIQDANGLNRFKSGFVVDNFSGHRVGDAANKDYKIAVDQSSQEARPKCVLRNAPLTENVSTDTARSAAGYQKTGDLLTLPYTSTSFAEQPYATRVENIQPYLVFGFTGKITLSPSGDEWFETEIAPALIINVDGNFDTFVAENENAVGTIWNGWETNWSGVTSSSVTNAGVRRVGGRHGFWQTNRTIDTVTTVLARTGTETSIVAQVDEESQGSKVISRGFVPFVRPRTIEFVGECFAPNSRVYVFFDGINVNAYVTPASSTFTSDTTIVASSPLITTASGRIEGSFSIPDYKFAGQSNIPKFRTGEVEFRITSSSINQKSSTNAISQDGVELGAPFTAGQTIYMAKGLLETEQETIIATRNAKLVQSSVDQTTTVSDQVDRGVRAVGSRQVHDPLAQTFMVAEDGGCFITEVDIFFAAKDTALPAWVEIRNVVNGYPGPKVLPFGRKVLEPADINIDSSTAATATSYTFDSPVYVQEGIEYCVVVMSDSLDYRLWISQMGEIDVGGTNRIVSKQPHLGVLFKSQNNTTWNSVQQQDMKFTLKKAVFDTTAGGIITLNNNIIGDVTTAEDGTTSVYGRRLQSNPLVLTNASTVMQVKHKNHGMYSTANNVTITGATSGITTTLATAITASTNPTLTSATGFTIPSNLQVDSTDQMFIKIDNEIIRGTIVGTAFTPNSRGHDGTTATAHSAGATIELYQLAEVPLTEINKTHTAIANIDMNSYTVALTTAPTIAGADATQLTAEVGGINTYATENYRFETARTLLATMELPNTSITATMRATSGTSPSGTESSFATDAIAFAIPINENFNLDETQIVCSVVNETNELSGAKSLFVPLKLTSSNTNLSPVIDLDRASLICVGNVLNSIDNSSDVYANYVASTEPIGDNNSAIYITKKVALQNPATALRVFFAGNVLGTSELEVLYKVLRSDSSDDFDDLGYEYFNTDGSPDSAAATSLTTTDFQEYGYSAGVKDDGLGESLPEFAQFAIKIVMKGTNAAQPPRIKDLRAIALAT
jgi:hypothetical protein